MIMDNKLYKNNAICVDFDGVIARFTDDIEDFGKIIPGSADALSALRSYGYKIIIHTARPASKGHLKRLSEYLNKEGIPFDAINQNTDCEWESAKPLADLYIDDRALRFNGNWDVTLSKAKQHLEIEEQETTEYIYEKLLNKVIERKEAVQKFDKYLKKNTSWMTAPASSRTSFHLCKVGGLLEHSVNVTKTLLSIRNLLAPELSEESCIITGLFHDLGKIGMPGQPYYIPNPSEWHVKNRGIRYIKNPGLVHMDIATRSLFLVSQHIVLKDDEAQAIRYHDGQYIKENESVAHKETKLTHLLQYADNWAGGVLEEPDGNNI